ncbi:MAG: Ig-like domain-containing protein [Cyclobacteriaceae bacterium]
MRKLLYLVFTLVCLSSIVAQDRVHMNFDLRHTVGGEDSFDRKKWMTVHSSNYEGSWDGELDKMEYLLEDLDVYLTRETGSITTEVSSRNAEEIAANAANYKSQYGNRTERHRFEAKQNLIVANQHRIYEEMSAEEAGERSAAFMNNYFGSGGADGMPKPVYFELLNEPLYPLFDFGNESIQDIFDYHSVMAKKIKELSPNTPVGGYVGAFSIFEENNFQRWNDRWKKYIDEVGDDMDFYSWHLYDFPGINNGKELYRKGANNEATFDMMEHYTWLVDKERPFVISEYGSQLHDWYEENWSSYRDWLFIKATNSMLMGFLERPDKMAIALPFTVIKARWGYGAFQSGVERPYPWRMMRQDTEPESYTVNGFTGDWVWTEYIKFYELWKDVNGTRVDTKSDNINMLVDAYIDGDKAFLIVNNLLPDTVDFLPDLKGLGNHSISSMSVRILYFDEASDAVKLDIDAVTYSKDQVYQLYPEATMVFEYTLDQTISIDQTSEETKYYASTYLQPISADQQVEFTIENVTVGQNGEAVLRIGVGRNLGASLTPKVVFNDTEIANPVLYRGDNQEERPRFFGVLEVEIPYELIKATNTIGITFPDGGGHVSSLALQVFNFSRSVTRTSITGITIDPDTFKLASGKTRKLFALVEPAGVDNKDVTWNSGDAAVATVSEDGTVTAVAEGITNISATSVAKDVNGNSLTATAQITVDDSHVTLIERIDVPQQKYTITIGDSLLVMASVLPQEAENKSIVWSSSADAIATVSQEGWIYAEGLGTGTITITAQDGSNVTGSFEVEIIEASFVAFDDNNKYLTTDYKSGETLEVSCNYNVGQGNTVAGNGVKFWLREITPAFAVINDHTVEVPATIGTQSGTASASISLEGVTASEDLPGDNFYFLFVNMTLSAGGSLETAVFPITVLPPDKIEVQSISLSPNTLTVGVNLSESINASLSPANATDKSVTWSSDNSAVATVSANGMVTGVSAGTAKITATSVSNPTVSGSVDVEVFVPLIAITLDPQNLDLKIDENADIKAAFNPENATNKEITWSSDNTIVATVDENGQVTALSEGQAKITATSVSQSEIKGTSTINVKLVLSSVPASLSSILVYPNPTNGLLYVDQLASGEYRLSAYDMSGRLLVEKNFNHMAGGASRIDLSLLPKGLNNVTISSEKEKFTFSLLIE